MYKFGCVFNHHDVALLFGKYDKDNSGSIDYRQFAQAFALKGCDKNPNFDPVFSVQ